MVGMVDGGPFHGHYHLSYLGIRLHMCLLTINPDVAGHHLLFSVNLTCAINIMFIMWPRLQVKPLKVQY